MYYADSLEHILIRRPTPAAAATAFAALKQLAGDRDFSATRVLATALAVSLGYEDVVPRIRQVTDPTGLLDEPGIPPLLRIYFLQAQPRFLIEHPKRCEMVAREVQTTDDFRRFQRLVRRSDLLQNEGLKAYLLAAAAMVQKLFPSRSSMLPVLDKILANSRVEPGAAVDMSFSVGRDKILVVSGADFFAILCHELGHHSFELRGPIPSQLPENITDAQLKSLTAPYDELFADLVAELDRLGTERQSESIAEEQPEKLAEKEPLTPAVFAELAAALPNLLTEAQKAERSFPQPLLLASEIGLLLSIERLPAGSYIHISLSDRAGPISRENAAEYAFLILSLIEADPAEAAAAMSPRGVFHFGVRHGPKPEKQPAVFEPVTLLAGLSQRSAAWLARLEADGRLTSDSVDIGETLGLVPPRPRYYPANELVWRDLAICAQLHTKPSVNSFEELEQSISAAIRVADSELLRALLQAAGNRRKIACQDIACAGQSLGVLHVPSGSKDYCGGAPEDVLATLKILGDFGGDLNCPIDQNGTTLLIAAARAAPEMAVALLAFGVDINLADASSETPLHAAAQNGWAALVEKLVVAGASVNAKNAKGATPLMEAAALDSISVAEVLLKHGANESAADPHGRTILMAASSADFARRLLEAGADANARDHTGVTALMYATERRVPGVVRALLKARADPGAATSKGETALHYAAKLDDCLEQQECIGELLAAGADVDEETEEGVTPLMIAARAGHPEAMRCLLVGGARVDARSVSGQTALCFACDPAGEWSSRDFRKGNLLTQCIRVLADAKADLNAGGPENGATALHHASVWLGSYILETLLELGADPNVRTHDGATPLMSAARKRNPDMVKALVVAGAEVNACDRDGNTALAIAVSSDALEADQEKEMSEVIPGEEKSDPHAFSREQIAKVVEVLLDNGADPYIRNATGNSAAMLAVNAPLPQPLKERIAAGTTKLES
jgi:ankyrin repeat protein